VEKHVRVDQVGGYAARHHEHETDISRGSIRRLKVDVIVTNGTPGARAAKPATTTIPVVVAIIGDAVAAGIVPSLARPGGNITGSQFHFPDSMA